MANFGDTNYIPKYGLQIYILEECLGKKRLNRLIKKYMEVKKKRKKQRCKEL